MSKRKHRWDKHAIRAAVHRKGKSLRQLAEENGLSESACRSALVRKHPAGERAIAAFLDLPPALLWPQRYPSSSRSRAGSTPKKPGSASPIVGRA